MYSKSSRERVIWPEGARYRRLTRFSHNTRPLATFLAAFRDSGRLRFISTITGLSQELSRIIILLRFGEYSDKTFLQVILLPVYHLVIVKCQFLLQT